MVPDRPMPARRGSTPLLLVLLPIGLGLVLVTAPPDDGPSPTPTPTPTPTRPDLTDPVLCLSVQGFREFEPRERPELSRDEKLQIYYEPFNFTIARVGPAGQGGNDGEDNRPAFRAHLTQDIRIRRAGEDRVLQERKAIIDYAPEAPDPPTSFYMFTTLELKQYPIGSYEADLVLRDELAEGKPETLRTVPFRVVATVEAPPPAP